MKEKILVVGLPIIVSLAGACLLHRWFQGHQLQAQEKLNLRAQAPPPTGGLAFFRQTKEVKVPLPGKLKVSGETPAENPVTGWPRFRGINFDGINSEPQKLTTSWPASGPKVEWSLDLGEGYSGAVIAGELVYILDYDQAEQADCLRCLTLKEGKELWRRWYSVPIRRQHGYSRTVPAMAGKYIATLGPMCHVLCSDASTGEVKWFVDLLKDYSTIVPEWYAGQCPLIDAINGKLCVVIAPGGKALMFARECETGKIVWQTPNPKNWQMTHASIVPMSFGGSDMYIYPASGGVIGVEKSTGRLLWRYGGWRISPANVPTPIIVSGGKILLSGGYGAGALMLQLQKVGNLIKPSVVFRVKSKIFGAEQQTPILYQGYLYTVLPPDAGGAKGQLACMDLKGNQIWKSGTENRFGLGPFLIADGKLFLVDDHGTLTMAVATHTGYQQLARHKVLQGHDSWAPLAFAKGRLLVRDSKRMVCLDMRDKGGM